MKREVKAQGVGRSGDPDPQAQRVLEVFFTERLTDDELRSFHDHVAKWRSEREVTVQ